MKCALNLVAIVVTIFLGAEAFGGDALDKARQEMSEGRFDESVRLLNERLEKYKADIEALKLRALAKSGLGRYDEAIADYEAVLDRRPGDSEIHRDLGMLLAFKKKDSRHALVHLDRYLSLECGTPKSADVARLMRSLDDGRSKARGSAVKGLIEMGKEFETEQKMRSAIRAYERALEVRPTCAACHELLGRLLINENKKEEGERHLLKAGLFSSGG